MKAIARILKTSSGQYHVVPNVNPSVLARVTANTYLMWRVESGEFSVGTEMT